MSNTLLDFIRLHGAPDSYLDNAKTQLALRSLISYSLSYQTTPFWAIFQNQNLAERRIQDCKHLVNSIMDRTATPAKFWLLCLDYAVYVLNHTCEVRDTKTPLEKAHGQKLMCQHWCISGGLNLCCIMHQMCLSYTIYWETWQMGWRGNQCWWCIDYLILMTSPNKWSHVLLCALRSIHNILTCVLQLHLSRMGSLDIQQSLHPLQTCCHLILILQKLRCLLVCRMSCLERLSCILPKMRSSWKHKSTRRSMTLMPQIIMTSSLWLMLQMAHMRTLLAMSHYVTWLKNKKATQWQPWFSLHIWWDC